MVRLRAYLLILILDCRSTSSIFRLRTDFSVRSLVQALVTVTVVSGLFAACWFMGPSEVFPKLIQAWWTFPIFFALISAGALVAPALIGRLGRNTWSTGLSTRFYLVSGPSAASINLLSLVPGAPAAPGWAGPSTLLLLLICAWGYYAGLREQDELERSCAVKEPPFSA
jgi:hypothetical protein